MTDDSKPWATGENHLLNYFLLSAEAFERLTIWLIAEAGYTNAEPVGSSGNEDGQDILARKDGRLVAFQCKRKEKVSAVHLTGEIEKIRGRPREQQPDEVIFVTPAKLSLAAIDAARAAWGDPATCNFWFGSEFDRRVKKHPEVVREFFQIRPKPAAESLLYNFPYGSLGAFFQGREEWLDRLRQSLLGRGAGQATAIAGQALHGLGGVGKSRLAVEYANRYAKEYRASFFVVAESPESLRRDLAKLAGATYLNLPESSSPEEAVQEAATIRWLREHPGWLLVLDNVDSRDAAKAVNLLLAQLQEGHALLTGRLARWGAEVHALELGLLAPEDAVAFLLARTEGRRRAVPDDALQAARVAKELGHLPLALEQAAAYISEQRQTFAGYLQEWETRREKVLAWFDPEVSHYPASVAVTWQTSVDRLTAPARRLLERLAWLGPEPIPESLLEVPVGEEVAEGEAGDAKNWLAELESYSLVSRSSDAPTFTVHRLVQEVTRRSLAGDVGETALREALEWVNRAFVGDPQDVRTWPVLEPLAPHTQAVVGFADDVGIAAPTAQLMNNLGQLYDAKALLAQAEPLMRRALAIDEASFGTEHPEVAINLSNLAQLLKVTNRLAEAETLMRRALIIDEATFGTEHSRVATQLNNLAQLLKATNRLAEAEPLMRRALVIDEASFGTEHPTVGRDLNNLAALLLATNRLAECEPLMRRALAIDEGSFGSEHSRVAIHLNNLAALLQATNRLAEAEPLMRRALAIDEASFKADHPKVAIRLNNLAQLLQEANRLADAEPLMRRALAIDEAAFGTDHPDVAADLNNLAQLLQATNRLAEAEPLMRRALAIDEASFGTQHPRVAIHLNNLAQLLQATNCLAEAEPLMRRALAIDEASFGTEHPNVARNLNNLAQLLKATNRLDEAEPLMRRAIAIDEASFGTEHPEVATDLNNLAQLLQATNRLAEAEPLMRRALAIDEASFGTEHPEVARDLNNLAQLLRATNRLAEAETLMRRVVEVFLSFSRATGHEHPQRRTVLANYSSLLQQMGRSEDEVRETFARLGVSIGSPKETDEGSNET